MQDLGFRVKCFPKMSGHRLQVRTTTSQKCEAVPRRARIQGSYNCVSLSSRVDSD